VARTAGLSSEERLNADTVRAFYDARARSDLDAVREMLAEGVIWREPDVGNAHTGDLRGAEAVLGMIREAARLTDGTFELWVSDAVAHGEQVAAFIDWSSTRDGTLLKGKEIAVYRVRNGKITEAYFHQNDLSHDEEFWA